MKKNIIIITGGAGFVGSHMIELLLKKTGLVNLYDNIVSGLVNHYKLKAI